MNLIVACCEDGGIGKDNQIPWKLKKDLIRFKKITTNSTNGMKNCVIMGRKTWDSLP
jgi:dihydrofolate reductase